MFDKTLRRNVYVADGSRLEYETQIGSSGTILVKALTNVVNTKRYILELKDNNNEKIGLYIGTDNYLYIHHVNSYKTSLYFTPEQWNIVGLSFTTNVPSDSESVSETKTFS